MTFYKYAFSDPYVAVIRASCVLRSAPPPKELKASQAGLGTASRRDRRLHRRRNVHTASVVHVREAGAREGGQWKRRCDKKTRAPEVPEHLHGRRLELQTEYVAQQAGQTEVHPT
jgi:hypothetical protein